MGGIVVGVGSVPRKIRKINNASFVWRNFVRTVIAFGKVCHDLFGGGRMLLLAEPRLSPPYPLARTFAPPPHFRPHHNRIWDLLHILQYVNSVVESAVVFWRRILYNFSRWLACD